MLSKFGNAKITVFRLIVFINNIKIHSSTGLMGFGEWALKGIFGTGVQKHPNAYIAFE